MSTRRRSTWRPSRKERLLLDNNVIEGALPFLRHIGFVVQHANHVSALQHAVPDDEVVRWARERDRIVVTHNRWGRPTTAHWEAREEIAARGGRAIVLTMDSIGDLDAVIGTLRQHRTWWITQFDEHGGGMATIHAHGTTFRTPDQLWQKAPGLMNLEFSSDPLAQIEQREPYDNRPRCRVVDPNQRPLSLPDLDESDEETSGK